ncbi:MAG: helix-turn-helix transcriptional regulator [Deltaproteobacteria bacterium]|nr:helix-turn-helix transcriptional regulator [Deltaproteobacteria bacterium]MBW1818932.1 helix-turn-helix transcriptional regulator [Deltaproteobacteria bacterium]
MSLVREISIEYSVNSIGNKIKMLRSNAGFSLQELAKRAGVSSTAIHKIERSEMTPTITVLMKIADVFGKKVGFFIGEEDGFDQFELVRDVEFYKKKDRKRVANSRKTIEFEPMTLKLRDGNLHGGIFYILPGEKSINPITSHHGEEIIYQLEGAMECRISDKTYVLRPGDNLHFRATLSHSWRVLGNQRSVNLWFMTPPPFGATEVSWEYF